MTPSEFRWKAVAWDALFAHAAAAALVLLLTLSASASFRSFLLYSGQTLTALLVIMVWACFGCGALLARPGGRWSRRKSCLAAAAAAGALAGGFLLAGHPGTIGALLLGAAALAAAGAAMAFYGAVSAAALSRAVAHGRACTALAVSASGAGTVLGFGGALVSAQACGVDVALLGLAALSLAEAGRRAAGPALAALAFLAVSPWLPALERRIEAHRAVPLEGMWVNPGAPAGFSDSEKTMLYWGGSGKFELYETADFVYLFYNSFCISQHPSARAARRAGSPRRLEDFLGVEDGDRVLSIGAADGYRFGGLVRTKTFALTLVEINDAVVRAYRGDPWRSGGAYLRARVLARDGRAVLEASAPGYYDLVLFEFADSGSNVIGEISQNFTLGTREAVSALDRALSARGRIIFLSFNAGQALGLAGGLRERGWSVRAYRRPARPRTAVFSPHPSSFYDVLAQRRPGPPRRPTAYWSDSTAVPPERFIVPSRDDFPLPSLAYLRWLQLPREELLRAGAAMAALALLAGAFLVCVLPRAPFALAQVPPAERFFLCIGAGYALIQLFIHDAVRPLLGESLSTTVAINVGLGAAAALGSLATFRWRDPRRGAWLLAAAAAGALAIGGRLLRGLRLAGPGMDIPWLGLFASLLPLGLVAGLFFPCGLALLRPHEVKRGLCFDALGAVGGFALYKTLVVLWGTGSIAWACAGLYACAYWWLSRAALAAGSAKV